MIVRRRPAALAAVLLCLAAVGTVAGCGSGGGSGQPRPIVDPADLGQRNVTRATETTLSEDAKALAITTADGPWLSLNDARRYDADLARIRAQFPAVAGIRPRPAFVPTDLLVIPVPGASWADRWAAGEPFTGDPTVDTLLREFDAVSVRPLGANAAAGFVLTFGQSLNAPALAARFGQGTAGAERFAAVSPNGVVGGGAQSVGVTPGADGARVYVFSRGWGDCQAGCINRHTWTFTVPAGDGPITLVEAGPPLPE